jgi:hypothetical protein
MTDTGGAERHPADTERLMRYWGTDKGPRTVPEQVCNKRRVARHGARRLVPVRLPHSPGAPLGAPHVLVQGVQGAAAVAHGLLLPAAPRRRWAPGERALVLHLSWREHAVEGPLMPAADSGQARASGIYRGDQEA